MTMAAACDIISLRKAFLHSFNTIGNMPEAYTIHTDPNIQPVQHARCRVPIEYREQKKTLQELVDLQVIPPSPNQPTRSHPSHIPANPMGPSVFVLNLHDVNKAIIKRALQ